MTRINRESIKEVSGYWKKVGYNRGRSHWGQLPDGLATPRWSQFQDEYVQSVIEHGSEFRWLEGFNPHHHHASFAPHSCRQNAKIRPPEVKTRVDAMMAEGSMDRVAPRQGLMPSNSQDKVPEMDRVPRPSGSDLA